MATNKRKTTTAIVAGVAAVALLIGGTFAWTSISQQAKNEAAGVVNVGGRLHDDFDGTNKDVYVENFTDPLNGGQPIYARIKLTEYMEVGQDAGGYGKDTNNDGKVTAVPVVDGTSIDDKANWPVHVPASSCAICNTSGTCVIHEHWTWTMGGDEGSTGQTTFMPTFNKDKDSLAADINGTYHGTLDTDKVYYDDYVVYTTDTTGGAGIAEADKEAYDGEIYSVTGTEYYDNDTDTADNNGTRQEANKTHTAKETATATVMTMADWIAAGSNPGNFWVYDTDGWAYWANPIMPGEATGLLLDSIVMEKNPGEKCYYAINVVGQFATVNDWEYFYTDEESKTPDMSDEAKAVLEAAAGNVATVTVINTGSANLKPGESTDFSATVSVARGTAAFDAGDFTWSVLNGDLTENTTSEIVENANGTATLTIGADETSTELIVVAKATDGQYLGALGMTSVAVEVEVEEEVVFTASFETTDDLSAAAYAVITKIAPDSEYYQLSFVRTNETITENEDTLNDVVIEKVYDVDETESGGNPGWWYDAYEFGSGYKFSNIEFLNTIAPTTTLNWFESFDFIESIKISRKFNTSKLKDMQSMFEGGNNSILKSVDMSAVDFNGAEVNVSVMFKNNSSLVEVSLPKNVTPTNMDGLFYSCSSLEKINGLDTWDVSKCSDMSFTFYLCEKITNLDLSSWNTASATNMEYMFGQMTSLETLILSEFNTSQVTTMESMFWGTSSLTLNCSDWDVTNVTLHDRFNQSADGVTPPTWVN